MLGILQRYVLKDVLRTFLLAVAVFTGIVLLGIIYEFVRNELSLSQMLRLVPYGMPFTLPFTLPIAALLATSLTFGRLSVDNEITAIRTSGVPLYIIILPMIIFGIAVSYASKVLQDDVVPPLNYKIKDVKMLAAEILMDQKEGYNFRRRFSRFQIFASHVRGAEYRGLVVFITRKSQVIRFVAERGTVGIGDDGRSLEIQARNASFVPYILGDRGESLSPVHSLFPQYTLKIPIRPRAFRATDKSTSELLGEAIFHGEAADAAALRALPAIREEEGAIEVLRAKLAAAANPAERAGIEAEIAARERTIDGLRQPGERSREIYCKNVAAAMGRRSLALACLLSAVLGSTLPILMRPRNALIPFFAGVLIVIVFYFPLHRLGVGLSEKGTISPWIGPWIPDILGGGLAGYLLWRTLGR